MPRPRPTASPYPISITRGAAQTASPAAVLDVIAAAFARRREGPAEALRRSALSAAMSLAETSRASCHVGETLADVWVPRDDRGLAALACCSSAAIDAGLTLLLRTGLVRADREGRIGLTSAALADHPVAARVEWDAVRNRLGALGTSGRQPALAALREIAIDHGASPEEPSRLPVAEIADRALFGRSTVLDALDRLQRAGLIRREARGRQCETYLLPAAFGATESTAARQTPAGESSSVGVLVEIAGRRFPLREGESFPAPPGWTLTASEVLPDGGLLIRYGPA